MPERGVGGPAIIPAGEQDKEFRKQMGGEVFSGTPQRVFTMSAMRHKRMVNDLDAKEIMRLMVLQGDDPKSVADEFHQQKQAFPEDDDDEIMSRIYGYRRAEAFSKSGGEL